MSGIELLYQKSQYIDAKTHYDITETIEQLKTLDARWNEDILKSRLQLNNNYDNLVNSLQSGIGLEKKLSDYIQKVSDQTSQIHINLNQYKDNRSAKTELVEQFKSENSIIRNSFLFIPFSIK